MKTRKPTPGLVSLAIFLLPKTGSPVYSQNVKPIPHDIGLTTPSGSPLVVTVANDVPLALTNGTENTVSDANTSARHRHQPLTQSAGFQSDRDALWR